MLIVNECVKNGVFVLERKRMREWRSVEWMIERIVGFLERS